MHKIAISVMVLAAFALPAAAAPICQDHPADQWMSTDAITKKVTDMGYVVKKLGTEDGCYEVKGTKDGKRVEAYFDPVSGELVLTK
ncbi:MAG TPA: PepSY domain-containing protein [Aestuariivirga sp.]|nr:PepSY domain-containing protein [Aestuariivirga sp.]